jgi:hypothetical protein
MHDHACVSYRPQQCDNYTSRGNFPLLIPFERSPLYLRLWCSRRQLMQQARLSACTFELQSSCRDEKLIRNFTISVKGKHESIAMNLGNCYNFMTNIKFVESGFDPFAGS